MLLFGSSSLLFVTSSNFLAVKRPNKSSLTTPNCFRHLSHTHHCLLVPNLHPPLIHKTYQHLSLNGKHHSLLEPFKILYPMFSVFPLPILPAPYLISTDTVQVLNAITLFFSFNVEFNISFSLLFYPLANSLFFSPFRLLHLPH